MVTAAHTWALEQIEVPAALPDLSGGPAGVIPSAALASPLAVKVPLWANSNPTRRPETLCLLWDGITFDTRVYSQPISDSELEFSVPQPHLQHGTHQLSYSVQQGSDLPEMGPATAVTIDQVPPLPAGPLGFPPETNNGVTDDYLQAHGDVLLGSLPAYAGQAPGDTVAWYWDRNLGGNEQVNVALVADLSPAFTLPFPGQVIRERGAGTRYAHYTLTDYAGNSGGAQPVALQADPLPKPRRLPRPSVVGASGSGNRQTLPARAVVGGVSVEIPPAAVFRPGDSAALVFGEPGQVGGARVPFDGAGAVVPLDEATVAAHIGQEAAVGYEVTDAQGMLHCSDALALYVDAAGLVFPRLTCALINAGELSLAQVTARGSALLVVPPWQLMSAGQALCVQLHGVGERIVIVEQHRELATGEVGKPVEIDILPEHLRALALNEYLDIEVMLSFDAGRRWPERPTFAPLNVLLVR